MAATAQSHIERAELEAVLESGILHRAPNLASFLRYVCERYFEGFAGQIKEYSIAVDALGRPADFDQKKDSIVRVEAHRLRKRLNDYYAGEGASHPVQIVIPNGQYSPQFRYTYNKDTDFGNSEIETPAELDIDRVYPEYLQQDTPQPQQLESHVTDAPAREAPVLSRENSPGTNRPSAFIILLATAIAGMIGFAVWVRIHSDAALSNEIWKGPLTVPVASDYRFLAGYQGVPFQDRQGRTWQPDAYYTGGQSRNLPAGRLFEAVPDPAFLRTSREGTFRYDIPVREGTYELHLYFVETKVAHEAETGRLFRIALNGRILLDLFDVAAEAGAQNRLLERVYKDVRPGNDGRIHVSFEGISDQGFLSAAEILASAPGRTRPVRVVASETSVVDADGQLWSADQYSIGGRLVKRTDGAVESHSQQLYEGERYGNFSYHIPLAPGKYRVRLFFAETWFGSKLPYAPSELIGARVFNVFANGVALLRDFDIAREAQGSKKGIEETFENLEPNAQGKIVLEFVPVRNYAEVNAIEVTQMQ